MPGRRYTPEMAVDLRACFDVRISPDGASVAFRVEPLGHRGKDRTSTIFVVQADGSDSPRPITDADHNNVSPAWSPDSRTLAFLSDHSERGTAQLHVVSAAGGEPLRLTDLAGGVGNPAWTPDGRAITFTARRRSLADEPEPRSDVKVASEQWRPQAIARVPASGGAPVIVGPATGHVALYAWSPDGSRIAAFVTPTEDLAAAWDNLRLIVFTPGEADSERELLRLSGFANPIIWSLGGRLLATIGSRLPDVDPTNIFVVDIESGDVTVLDDRGMTPEWIAFYDDGLLVHAVETQQTRIDRTDIRGSEWDPLDLGHDANEGWIEADTKIDSRDGAVAASVARFNRPGDLYIASRGGQFAQLTDLNPQLECVELASMEPLVWTSTDGMQVHGWLMLPPSVEGAERLPLVTAIHGGPSWQWGNWFHGTWHDWGQILSAAGYAVFLPNPRGSTGRGGAFTGANRFDFGGRDFEDIMTGIDHLIERGIADSDRLGICGWSYGGFMTAWAVTQTDRFKAAVAGAAPTNWVSKIGTTDIRPFNEWNLGEVNTDPDRVWERSPIRYVSRVTTPTLLVHGEADKRVPVTQGMEFYLALRATGVPTDLISYPRQGHAFHERTHQLDLLQRLVGWMDRYVKAV